ncbi:MAG: hypothetical protein GY906_22020 [bacterium]|nr:hypothetical protein [bacterium]
MNRFLTTFPIVTLVVFGSMLPILLGAAVVVFQVDIPSGSYATTPLLPGWIVAHTRVFATMCLSFNVVALAASYGMTRKQKWAHSTWIVLIAVALLWEFVRIFSAIMTFFSGERGSSGWLSSSDVFVALGAVVPAAGFLILGTYLLRKLVKTRPS